MKIVFLPSAEASLLRISLYGKEHFGENTAREFLTRFIKQIEILKTFPDLGTVFKTDHEELNEITLRRIVFEGHQIFYQVLDDKIKIYTIIAKGEPLENILG